MTLEVIYVTRHGVRLHCFLVQLPHPSSFPPMGDFTTSIPLHISPLPAGQAAQKPMGRSAVLLFRARRSIQSLTRLIQARPSEQVVLGCFPLFSPIAPFLPSGVVVDRGVGWLS